MLDEEAGISAWYQASGTIDLDLVRGEFRTIELDTGAYILGSVAVPNYQEAYDVHVYVHQDGWILAYYLNDEPSSKIVEVKGNTIDTTNFKNVISIVAGAAGYPVIDVSYYDFRYPNATNMLIVAENSSDGNDFTIEIPSSFAYFERSWAAAGSTAGGHYLWFDGTANPNQLYNGFNVSYGTISAAQFVPDIPHNTQVWSYGVLVIVYRVP
ncbi:MAG: hypothetical protein HND44_21390 [Chloroflexi bacterium]|nr:hypothetical protein [Ardenticatenaceae bacterium]MBL1130997.1 hypothetical protein [Chloroflexota bacterium]NOG37095.1 hypothetical protein [Chloroflexota bacterium]GIK58773.1 MAG: hypothetical protein BroJett015_44360 [Chloroflexota bacterium]